MRAVLKFTLQFFEIRNDSRNWWRCFVHRPPQLELDHYMHSHIRFQTYNKKEFMHRRIVYLVRPASWSSGESLCLLIMRSPFRFATLLWEFSLKGRIPAVNMVWVGLRALLALHPPISPLTSSGQRNRASWASQPQKSVTHLPCPGGKTTKSTRTCGGIGGGLFIWSRSSICLTPDWPNRTHCFKDRLHDARRYRPSKERDPTYKFSFEVSGFWSRHSACKRNVYIQWTVSWANKKKYH